MRKFNLRSAVLAVLSIFFLSGTASASFYFKIIEKDYNVYDVVLSTDAPVSFDGWTASFNYDNEETLDLHYTFTFLSPRIGLSEGKITINSETLIGNTVLATFTFTGEGDANFRFDMTDPDMEFILDNVTYSVSEYPELYISSRSASVPLPAAVWGLGSGLIGLFAIRRRQE